MDPMTIADVPAKFEELRETILIRPKFAYALVPYVFASAEIMCTDRGLLNSGVAAANLISAHTQPEYPLHEKANNLAMLFSEIIRIRDEGFAEADIKAERPDLSKMTSGTKLIQ